MPKKFPPEFKGDVVRVARRGDLSQAEVAADLDMSVKSVRRWVRQADIDDGAWWPGMQRTWRLCDDDRV